MPAALPALVRFIGVRAELFRIRLFSSHRPRHRSDAGRTVRRQQARAVPGNPLEHLAEYRRFHRVVAVGRRGPMGCQRRPGTAGTWASRWRCFLARDLHWKMAGRADRVFHRPAQAERASIFSREEFFEQALREALPAEPASDCRCALIWPGISIGPARAGPAAGPEFLYDPATRQDPPALTITNCCGRFPSVIASAASMPRPTRTMPNWPRRSTRWSVPAAAATT